MSNYPGSLDSFTDGIPNQPLNNPSLTNIVNDLNAAVRAIQQTLGINPQAPESSLAAKLTAGIGLREILVFESSDVFVKADYSWLRAVRVRVKGGGGACGGADNSAAGGGASGAYSESFLLAEQLDNSESIVVGQGGPEGSSGSDGNSGSTSSFGSLVIAPGGEGGGTSGIGGLGQGPGTGQIALRGDDGGSGSSVAGDGSAGFGAAGVLGSVARPGRGGINAAGRVGREYGGGASGARSTGSQPSLSGADGVVILELYG